MLSVASRIKDIEIFIILALLFCALLPTNSYSDTNSKINSVTAVVVKNFPPHYSVDENGNTQGFAIDVFNILAKEAGLNVNYIIKDSWKETAAALKNGEADLIPNLGITQTRKADFDFSTPFEIYPVSIITRAESKNIKSKEDLTGKTVGVVRFNIGIKIAKTLPNINLKIYEKPQNALIGLLAGHIDAIIYPKSVIIKVSREAKLDYRIKILSTPLKEIKRAVAVRKGNSELLVKLNKAIDKYLVSKEYKNIYLKWYGRPTPFWTTIKILFTSGVIIFLIVLISGIWRFYTLASINVQLVNSISERKLLEQKFEAMFNAIPDAVMFSDTERNIVMNNPAVHKMFGYNDDELIGNSTKILHANQEEYGSQGKKHFNSKNTSVDGAYDVQYKRKDDSIFWAESIGTSVHGSNDEIIGFIGLFRDITERKHNIDALRESSLLLENVINSTSDLIFAKNKELKTILANKALALAVGKKPHEMLGKTDIENGWDPELVKGNPDKNIKGFENDDKQALQGNIVHNPRDPANVDGEIRIFDTQKLPLRDSKGEIIGMLGIARDTTERLQAEEKIQHQQKELQQILDSMIDAVITIDEIGTILSFNKTAENLFGYNSDEVLGKNIKVLMPTEIANNHDDYLRKYLETKNPKIIDIGREVEALRKDNSHFPMRLSIAPLPINSEGKVHFIGTCQDLTQQQQQDEQLRRSQKMDALGKLTGGIAHDYNNMLGVITGYADLLKNLVSDQPKLFKYANEIAKAGERGAKLTKKLLIFSRKKNTDAENININELLLNEQHMLEKTLTARIRLVLNLCKSPWSLWLDASDLEDSILNICINSMNAIEVNGELIISTENKKLSLTETQTLQLVPGDYLLLKITDTGVGIDEETREKIFDPFFSTKGDQGTGLGLSQVYGFVERSGGIIKVFSEIGKGTELLLYFPRSKKEPNNNAVNNIEDSNSKSYLGRETILVVDDELALLELTTEVLELAGYKVTPVDSAKKALHVLKSNSVSLMISDVIMPDMDGYQLSAIVQEKYPDIKILLASGFSDKGHRDMVDKSLHENLLVKPYHTSSLLKKIRDLLEEKD